MKKCYISKCHLAKFQCNIKEKKLERQKRSCSSQVAKLEVRTLLSLFAIVNVDDFFFLQARNDTLLRNEREAYETVRSNNQTMRKVYPNPNHES